MIFGSRLYTCSDSLFLLDLLLLLDDSCQHAETEMNSCNLYSRLLNFPLGFLNVSLEDATNSKTRRRRTHQFKRHNNMILDSHFWTTHNDDRARESLFLERKFKTNWPEEESSKVHMIYDASQIEWK